MSWLHFNPADIQSLGIGVAAFLATVLTVYLYLSVRTTPLGRAFIYTFGAAAVWSWFGFLYHITSDLSFARDLRVVSVMGIIFINLSELNFALKYLQERVEMSATLRRIQEFFTGGALALLLVLLTDLLGTNFIVGELLEPSNIALAPQAGPFMVLLIGFYVACISFSGYLLALRARHATDEADRRQALILFVSMTIGLFLGGTRFSPWFGIDFYPLVGNIGYPIYVFVAIYAIRQYKLLNLQVAAAQFLILVLWTFTFFRILLSPSLMAAVPDIGLFLASLVIGVLLLRSVIAEMRTQQELAKLLVDKAKSEFITVAAHQLRTPASAVRWSFELLQDGVAALKPEQQTAIEHGKRAAGNLVHIINDLLDMGRMGDGKFRYEFRDADISDLVRESAKISEDAAARKKIRLTLDIPTLPHMVFDPDKLGLAVQNLVDNAIKYTQDGGTVLVSLAKSGDGVRIAVKDSGIGFTEDEKKRIFEKFFRGSRAVHISPDGSGLGLVIAKTIVEGHGGTLQIVSEENKGSDIAIILPGKPVERS